MTRRNMEFGADARMITCPRKGTADNAPSAPSISRAHATAAHLERARDQRVFHAGRWRGTGGPVSLWHEYAPRHGAANRLLEDVWSAARQVATRTDRRARVL